MEFLVILLIFASAIMHTYWNYALKKTINKGADEVSLYWLSIITGTLLYSVAFIFLINHYNISGKGIFFAALFGFFTALYIFVLSKAYKSDELSKIYPLTKTTPLFTLLIGVFYLKEKISLIGLIGIILIIFGVYFINLKDFKFKNLIQPLHSLKYKGPLLALLAAIISAVYGLFSKLGVTEINPLIFIYFGYIFLIIFYIPLLYFKKQTILSQIKKFKISIIKIGIFDLVAYLLVIIALTLSKLSYVFALRQMSILLSVFSGIYLLKEKYGKTKIIASIIIIMGIILLAFA